MSLSLEGIDPDRMFSLAEVVIGRISGFLRKVAVAGVIAAVVAATGIMGGYVLDSSFGIPGLLVLTALLASPALLARIMAGSFDGIVTSLRGAESVLRSWADAGQRDEKVARLTIAVEQVRATPGRFRRLVGALGLAHLVRAELAELRGVAVGGRLASSPFGLMLCANAIGGTALVCWIAFIVLVGRVGSLLL